MDRLTWDGTLVNVFTFTGADRTDSRTYRKGTGENDLVAQTNYKFDAFGRMNEIDATDTVGAHIVDFRRAYDYNGNPLYTEYAHKTTRSEIYGTQTGQDPEGPADALNRLTRYRRGTLNANKDDLTATVFEQDWHDTQGALELDKLGNWDMLRTDMDGTQNFTVETKGHNLANEYTSKNGQSAYAHDDDGNLTDDGTFTFAYDFANHVVKATRKSDSAVIGEYLYDALGRRVKKVVTNSGDLNGTTLFYYDGLRVLEEGKLDGNNAYKATHQYVWGLYLDELLLYDYDADADGDFDAVDQAGGDKRYYALQHFTYTNSAVVTSDSGVQELRECTPYGALTFWSPGYEETVAATQVHLPFAFTGQRYDDETSLHHDKARALRQSFVQRDPLEPHAVSYEYARSAPCLYLDPLGLCDVDEKTMKPELPALPMAKSNSWAITGDRFYSNLIWAAWLNLNVAMTDSIAYSWEKAADVTVTNCGNPNPKKETKTYTVRSGITVTKSIEASGNLGVSQVFVAAVGAKAGYSVARTDETTTSLTLTIDAPPCGCERGQMWRIIETHSVSGGGRVRFYHPLQGPWELIRIPIPWNTSISGSWTRALPASEGGRDVTRYGTSTCAHEEARDIN